MAAVIYPHHHRSEASLDVDAPSLFAYLDDHRRLADHMQKPSLMMAGATMQIGLDTLQGQAVGSVIRLHGQVFGMELSVEEVITERSPPLLKTWETRGEVRLLVIGAYRMGFTITPTRNGSQLVVFVDYRLPPRGIARGLGLLFGWAYARWCTRRMVIDAMAVRMAA